MPLNENILAGILVSISFTLVIAAMVALVRWARRRNKGAIAFGALITAFAPDPTFERNIKLAEEARTIKKEEDGEGEDY